MIKAVIFDWGGVIAPNPQGGWLNVLADMLGISLQEALPYWQSAGYTQFSQGLIDEQEFWSHFEKSYGHSLPTDKNRIWSEGSALNPWQQMIEFTKELRNNSIKTAILSNTVEPMSRIAREAGIYDGFDPIVLSDEVGLVKPNPAIYNMMLEKLELSPEECIFVDDLVKNLEPAAALGMATLLATDNYLDTIKNIQSTLR